MKQKNEVFIRVRNEYPGFVTCYSEATWYRLEMEFKLAVYKTAPEEVKLLVKAANKFYGLVEI